MFVKIAFVDDNPIEIEHLLKLAERWAKERTLDAEFSCHKSAEAFLFAYDEDGGRFDILLLDIQMGEIDGVTLARTIRARNEAVQILFVTGVSDYIAEGYEVSAVHYLLKPIDHDRLTAALDRAYARLNAAEPALLLENDGVKTRILHKDIFYIEAFSHDVTLHTANGDIHSKLPLAELEELLAPSAFVRCHRSYLVGLRHMNSITRTDVILDNGEKLPLSRRLHRTVHEAFVRLYRKDVGPWD